MRYLRFIVTAAALIGTTASASASSVEGKIVRLIARADGLHYVILDSGVAGRPACAAAQPYYMIADEHSDAGKSQFAILLSAYMSGKPVIIEGTGTCTRWIDGEDILTVVLQ